MNARSVNLSLRAYQILLAAYPRSHRDQYGPAMLQLFRDQCQDAWREHRRWGLALLWLRLVPDLLKTLVLEHLDNLKGKKLMPNKIFTGVRSSTAAKTAFLLVFFAVFFFILVTAMIVTFILPEAYASKARIKVERDVTDIPGAVGKRNSTGVYDPYLMQTEFEVIQSEVILDKVIDALNLNDVWAKKYNYDGKFATADSRAVLRKMIELRPARNTSLIDITVYSDDKNEAAKIANAIAECYQTYRRSSEPAFLRQAIHEVELDLASRDKRFDAQDDEARLAEIITEVNRRTGVATVGLMPVEIIEHAEPSAFPVRPNKPFNIFFGGVLGILLGLLAGGLVAFFVSKSSRPPPIPKPAAAQ